MKRLALLLALLPAVAAAAPMAPAEQNRVAESAARLIEMRYVDERLGREIASDLKRARWKPAEPEAFAEEMTAWLRKRAADGHFQVDYSAKPIPADGGEASFSEEEINRFYGPQLNHGFTKIERLDENIMLFDLRVFSPPAMAGDMMTAAMTLVAEGSALIIDLRRNGGGMETGNLLAGYLLKGGTGLSGVYDRPTGKLTPQTTPSWVPGRRFGDSKPVYILISKRTFSAAEALAYDLQALKRATIIGETSGGGANPFEYRRIDDHFALSLPEARSVNPITGTNWQGVGVKPDVAVPADAALETAVRLAREAIRGRSAGASDPRALPSCAPGR